MTVFMAAFSDNVDDICGKDLKSYYSWSDDDDELVTCCEQNVVDQQRSYGEEKETNNQYLENTNENNTTGPPVELKDRGLNVATDQRPPVEKFRPGYLWVSDLIRQNWCEQQLYYTFTIPGIVEENPVMLQGSSLHLARELAVHDIVSVEVMSSEDIWAVKLLNLLTAVQGFLDGIKIAREIPVFGTLYDNDTFLVGLVDELRFDPDNYTIELVELKTRQARSFPSKAQQTQHNLQVMLYKKLFDNLVQGKVSKEVMVKHLHISLDKELGEGVRNNMGDKLLSCKTLRELTDHLFERLQCLTCVSGLSIEYVHQESQETMFHHSVVYDENLLESQIHHYMGFWRGNRPPEGVDIEEAWKCQRCDFSSVCEWRQIKAEECMRKNKTANNMS
ncbi:hypothetical protein CHS0354_032786 [Potamilus streckersoni]|uniref:Exonuclease V n=1 Tax=Potamilus streckersoni TaxID=2493646 RepID=A0AAE0S906_9BIVA|nr:hypothetical protein CHS0354_032786 [Potamilus streckersoni]